MSRESPPPCPPPHPAEGREGGRRARTLILFPAIDLKDGVCVRLEQGDMGRATVFNRDAAAQAMGFAAEGFEYLHVVDLDGAFPAVRSMPARSSASSKACHCRSSLEAEFATGRRSRHGWKRAWTASSSGRRP